MVTNRLGAVASSRKRWKPPPMGTLKINVDAFENGSWFGGLPPSVCNPDL
ncbi:hypothetical protein COLO4_14035 [Corchorus olitorius]|uniref:Uncharacterized protein n=1 Tax=Corchorus olitorius TaxID=93759 RepID=A0A1R3JTT7_9ROSI|nr:hypothetical protein COLO4_14035 [Corchorus olitorius]